MTSFREALEERTPESAPVQWADTQFNLGNALLMLSELESGTARLEETVKAWDACLTVTTTVWPTERVENVCSMRNEAQVEIARRQAG